ncbi:MGAT4C [Symbiodinium sp. CCMP2592]|nr:MGAT4C [Symbiodinium sp. CCMP2592]
MVWWVWLAFMIIGSSLAHWLPTTLPRVAPWTVGFEPELVPCWRQDDSLSQCCKREGFQTCGGDNVRSRCCAFPGSVIHGEGLLHDLAEECWVTTSPMNVTQDINGPFWVRQRNYLVSWVLANHPSDVLDTPLREHGEISEEMSALLAAECQVGIIALQLLQSATCSSTRSAAAQQVLRMPWPAAVFSGWPVFLLLAHAAEDACSIPFNSSAEDDMLVALEGLCEKMEAAVAGTARLAAEAASSQDHLVIQPGERLTAQMEAAKVSLELLQKMAMREPSAPKPARLWLILHRLQEALSLRGTCPPGTFLTKVRALGWEYRICIRQPESLGSWLGGSLVDKRILNQGQWSECALSAELLPPPTSQLSPQHWRSAGSGCIVIDLGANIGACTLLFASMGHRVIAVEPEPSNLLMLHASLSLPQLETDATLGFGKVAISPVAVDEAAGTVQLRRNPFDAGNSTIVQSAEESAAAADQMPLVEFSSIVPARPLDEIAEEQAFRLGGSLSDICMMKMDIEGAELKALRSAPKLLAGPLRAISFEFSPGPTEADIAEAVVLLQLLAGHGFVIFGHRGLTSGLVVSEEREYAAHEFESLARHVASLRVPGLLSALKL